MTKKRILTKHAMPGMVAADDIYTASNQLIIEHNTLLDDYTITRLKFYSIDSFRIIVQDEPEFIPLESFAEHIKGTPEFQQFHSNYDASVSQLSDALNSFAENKVIPMNIHDLTEWTQDILINSRNGMHLFHMLHCMRTYSDETYAHSMNVAMICNALGNWLGLPRNEIDELTLAGLLHDVGKLFLPAELLKKTTDLTEEEIQQLHSHALLGYTALKRQPVNTHIRYGALMHHERCDGSGYPNHFIGGQIDKFAKIIAIADSYDAMTSPRVYRKALCPFEVVSLFQSEGLCLYDTKYLMTFLNQLINTFLHSRVRLNNEEEGEIVLINQSDLSKPMIKIGDTFVNLFKEHNLRITEILA